MKGLLLNYRVNSFICRSFKSSIENSRKHFSSLQDAENAHLKEFIEFSSPEKYSIIPTGFKMLPKLIPSHEQDFIVNEVEVELATNRYAKWNEFHRSLLDESIPKRLPQTTNILKRLFEQNIIDLPSRLEIREYKEEGGFLPRIEHPRNGEVIYLLNLKSPGVFVLKPEHFPEKEKEMRIYAPPGTLFIFAGDSRKKYLFGNRSGPTINFGGKEIKKQPRIELTFSKADIFGNERSTSTPAVRVMQDEDLRKIGWKNK